MVKMCISEHYGGKKLITGCIITVLSRHPNFLPEVLVNCFSVSFGSKWPLSNTKILLKLLTLPIHATCPVHHNQLNLTFLTILRDVRTTILPFQETFFYMYDNFYKLILLEPVYISCSYLSVDVLEILSVYRLSQTGT